MPYFNLCSKLASAPLAVAGAAIALTLLAASAAQAQPVHGPAYGGPGRGGPVVRCESTNGRYRECRAPFRGQAVLVKQLSDTRCIPGRTYGTKAGRVWVSGGCRGDFAQR